MSRLLIFNDLLTFVNADIIDENEEQPLKISFFLSVFSLFIKARLKKATKLAAPKVAQPSNNNRTEKSKKLISACGY